MIGWQAACQIHYLAWPLIGNPRVCNGTAAHAVLDHQELCI